MSRLTEVVRGLGNGDVFHPEKSALYSRTEITDDSRDISGNRWLQHQLDRFKLIGGLVDRHYRVALRRYFIVFEYPAAGRCCPESITGSRLVEAVGIVFNIAGSRLYL